MNIRAASFALLLVMVPVLAGAQSGNPAAATAATAHPAPQTSAWGLQVLDHDASWYGTTAARELADTVMQYQSEQGGWPKSTDLSVRPASVSEIPVAGDGRANTIDNDATTLPMKFLARVASTNGDSSYRQSFERGLDYLFAAQYPNGGWPQFWPLRGDEYFSRITYNDNAMIQVMELLRGVSSGQAPYDFVDEARRTQAAAAIGLGLDCILKTQVRQGGVLTAWSAQHDETTLEPAWGRTYEPPSLSGGETVGILRYLMAIENPPPAVIAAIEGGVAWLQQVAIKGVRLHEVLNPDDRLERILTPDDDAPLLWARFYEPETNRPLFLDRDSVYRYNFSELGYERRSGYSYHGYWPADLLAIDYPRWRAVQTNPGKPMEPPNDWYVQTDFQPQQRVEFVVHNTLDRARTNSPVTIRREQFTALPDVHELSITLVDPSLPGRPAPSNELLQRQGGHETQQETNGAWIPYQLDDLDQDGIWDELFFMADFAAGERKVFYLYLGNQGRGWKAHRTHAGTGSYMRHTVPFWEGEEIGWKLWFHTDIDVFGKRKPVLMSHRLYMANLDGYGVGYIDPAFGSDIMQVNNSFGGGGIGVFEDRENPDVVSRPRYSPQAPGDTNFNAGPLSDSRYAFTVIANGPVRSMVRARTMNWNSGQGRYELEQVYTAYAGESYSTVRVHYSRFEPENPDTEFAVGIRKHLDEDSYFQAGGTVISGAPEAIRNLDDEGLRENSLFVDFVGTALVVPQKYSPEYVFVPGFSENHAFRIRPNPELFFEYLIAAGWSDGSINRTAGEFQVYVVRVAEEFNTPVQLLGDKLESRTPN